MIVPDSHSYDDCEVSDGTIVSERDPSLLPNSTYEGEDCDRCSECASETSGTGADPHSIGASATAMCTIPMCAVGHVANFGIPPAGFSPAAVPPPGRFHPLPTRPVFSRR